MTRLGQHLRRHHPKRKPGIDDFVRQALGGESAALGDRVEADLLRVANALVDRGERPPVIEIRGVDGVPGRTELVGER